MARMYPSWATDAEVDANIPQTKEGWRAERHLYKLMRDGLPNDWGVMYDRIVSTGNGQTAQLDFLVFVPGKGVCNVDAKGAGYVFRDGHVRLDQPGAKDVFEEAKAGIHVFNNYVNEQITGGSRWGAFGRLVVFTETDFRESLPGGQPYLQRSDFLAPNGTENTENLKSKIEEQLNIHATAFPFFSQWRERILSHWTREIPSIPRPDDFTTMERFSRQGLSNEQQLVFDRINTERYVHVKGAAGTGKTLIALASAASFAKEGKRVLYVCFNKALAESCRFECPNAANVTIAHMHGLGAVLLGKDYSIRENGKFCRTKTDENIMKTLPQDFATNKKVKYDVLLIDEAQDLTRDNVFTLLSLLKRDRHVAVFSDQCQTLFATEWELDTSLFDCPLHEEILSKNYRNTDKIHSHFKDLSGETTSVMLRDCPGFSTKEVESVIGVDRIRTIVEDLLAQGRYPSEIAILTDEGVDTIPLLQASNPRGTPNPVPIKSYNAKSSWNDGKKILRQWHENKCILKETIQSFKGLEANCVILIPSAKIANEEKKNRLRYVGESRAKYELYIVSERDTLS